MRKWLTRRREQPWRVLTDEEMRAELERQAERLVGMPLDDLTAKHEADVLGRHPAADYLIAAAGGTSS